MALKAKMQFIVKDPNKGWYWSRKLRTEVWLIGIKEEGGGKTSL